MTDCRIGDCEAAARSKGLCAKHYMRVYRHGSPAVVLGHQEVGDMFDIDIISKHAQGSSMRQIAKDLNITRYHVARTINER